MATFEDIFNKNDDVLDLALDFMENCAPNIWDPKTKTWAFQNKIKASDIQTLKDLKENFGKSIKRTSASLNEAKEDKNTLKIIGDTFSTDKFIDSGLNISTNIDETTSNFCKHTVKYADYIAGCALKHFNATQISSWMPETAKQKEMIKALKEMKATNLATLCEHKIQLG